MLEKDVGWRGWIGLEKLRGCVVGWGGCYSVGWVGGRSMEKPGREWEGWIIRWGVVGLIRRGSCWNSLGRWE